MSLLGEAKVIFHECLEKYRLAFLLDSNCKLKTSKCYVSRVRIKAWMFIFQSEKRNQNITLQATIHDQDRILSMVKCIYIYLSFVRKFDLPHSFICDVCL